MYEMPDTKIAIEFILKPANVQYAPLYYGKTGGSAPMASLNAGNSQFFFVGGGGVNLGFEHALQPQNCGRYVKRHDELFTAYKTDGTQSATYKDEDPTKFSLIYAEKRVTQKTGWYDGLCFVDVFGDALCPHGNKNNAAMFYVAPPYGGNYAGIPEFLDAIRKTAGNIATALGQYNALAASASLPVLATLRLCLYSSGLYNSLNADLNDIAKSIYEGLHDVLKADACGLTGLEFPYTTDPHDPLFAAVKDGFLKT